MFFRGSPYKTTHITTVWAHTPLWTLLESNFQYNGVKATQSRRQRKNIPSRRFTAITPNLSGGLNIILYRDTQEKATLSTPHLLLWGPAIALQREKPQGFLLVGKLYHPEEAWFFFYCVGGVVVLWWWWWWCGGGGAYLPFGTLDHL